MERTQNETRIEPEVLDEFTLWERGVMDVLLMDVQSFGARMRRENYFNEHVAGFFSAEEEIGGDDIRGKPLQEVWQLVEMDRDYFERRAVIPMLNRGVWPIFAKAISTFTYGGFTLREEGHRFEEGLRQRFRLLAGNDARPYRDMDLWEIYNELHRIQECEKRSLNVDPEVDSLEDMATELLAPLHLLPYKARMSIEVMLRSHVPWRPSKPIVFR